MIFFLCGVLQLPLPHPFPSPCHWLRPTFIIPSPVVISSVNWPHASDIPAAAAVSSLTPRPKYSQQPLVLTSPLFASRILLGSVYADKYSMYYPRVRWTPRSTDASALRIKCLFILFWGLKKRSRSCTETKRAATLSLVIPF